MEAEVPAFPNKLVLMLLLSLEEVLGGAGLDAVLKLARLSYLSESYPPANFNPGLSFLNTSRLLDAVDELYGPRGGQQLGLQAGRLCFSHGVKDFGALLGVADLLFRVLPLKLRLRLGLEVLAEIANRYANERVRLAADAQAFYWIADTCGLCWDRRTTYPACSLRIGLIQETVYWVSRGRRFAIEEISCVGMGAASCTVAIGKSPLKDLGAERA